VELVDSLDLMLEIDKLVARSGLTHKDSIKDLIDALAKEIIVE
jgi:hypothetical protein